MLFYTMYLRYNTHRKREDPGSSEGQNINYTLKKSLAQVESVSVVFRLESSFGTEKQMQQMSWERQEIFLGQASGQNMG